MPYRVVKKINGCHYLYEQETYREGGKVRTRSQYIGAVDPVKIKALKAKGEPLDGALKNIEPEEIESEEIEPIITYTVKEVSPETLPSKAAEKAKSKDKPKSAPDASQRLNTTKLKEKPKPEKSTPSKPRLRIKAKVERHNISRAALVGEHKRFTRHMTRLGLKTDDIGRVIVGTGKQVLCRRQRSGNYVITLPRFKTKKKKGDIGPATNSFQA